MSPTCGILSKRVSCSTDFNDKKCRTYSGCPTGTPKIFTPCCSKGKDASPLHTIVSGFTTLALLVSPPLAGDAFTKKKNTDFFVLLCLPSSLLTFGKVNPGPPQTDIFLGRGSLPTPPHLILSAPASPHRLTFFAPPPPGLFLTLGKVKSHRHLGGGGGEGCASD